MWAMVVELGREPGLSAVWATLLCVRRAGLTKKQRSPQHRHSVLLPDPLKQEAQVYPKHKQCLALEWRQPMGQRMAGRLGQAHKHKYLVKESWQRFASCKTTFAKRWYY